MTEQEIIVELKKRWPEPHFKDWRVRENWGGSHMAECSVVGVEERFCERVVVATAGTHEKLLAAIRSLPVPSEPSGETQPTVPTNEYTEAADWLQWLAEDVRGELPTHECERLISIAALLRKVGPLVDQQSARIAELESQLTKALTPRCTYCLCAPCECALREAGPQP